MHLTIKPIGLGVLALALASPQTRAQLTTAQKTDIGFTALQTALGGTIPTGSGLSASQVEAPDGSFNYRPDTALFPGKSFVFPSAGTTDISSHASMVGRYYYGSASMTPNLGTTATADQISSWEANNWIGSGFLKTGTSSQLPAVEANDLQSHSWVGSAGASDPEILQRLDYAIHRDDYVATFGLNNNVVALPNLLASAYNGISVGRSDGLHSYGTTAVDGNGRMKPDIVVPVNATSWATPTVASAAGLLIEAARGNIALSNGARHEVVKALLLNGATKTESEFTHTWTHTQAAPLDTVYGAGELDVKRSYDNLAAGEYDSSTISLVGTEGWDLGTAATASAKTYFFDLPAGNTGTLTSTLAWDRIVTATDTTPGSGVTYAFSSTLANLDLKLHTASGFSLLTMLDQSVSTVDNVELLLANNLNPGRYAITVPSNTSGIDYGLAWKLELTPVPEPAAACLLLAGLLPVLRRRR